MSLRTALLESLESRQLYAATPSVVTFTLIDAGTDKPIRILKGGEQLNLATLPKGLNVRADIAGNKSVGSVTLKLDKQPMTTQSGGPFSLFNDDHGDYLPGTFTNGAHLITARSYAKSGAKGEAGREYKLSFTVVNKPVAVTGRSVSGLTLIDATTEQSLGSLSNGLTIDGKKIDITQLSVRADTTASAGLKIGSVKFVLDGQQVSTDNSSTYALFGNDAGDFFGGTLPVGSHTLIVTPFSGANGTGTAGTAKTVTFKVTPPPALPPSALRLYVDFDDKDVNYNGPDAPGQTPPAAGFDPSELTDLLPLDANGDLLVPLSPNFGAGGGRSGTSRTYPQLKFVNTGDEPLTLDGPITIDSGGMFLDPNETRKINLEGTSVLVTPPAGTTPSNPFPRVTYTFSETTTDGKKIPLVLKPGESFVVYFRDTVAGGRSGGSGTPVKGGRKVTFAARR